MEEEEPQSIFAFDDLPDPLSGNHLPRKRELVIPLSQEDQDRIACRNLGDSKYLLSVMFGNNPFIKARSV